jgi:hypothetical protein
MAQHIEQDVLIGTTVAQRSAATNDSFFRHPPTSVANDNVRNGPWPLVPFPEGLAGDPSGQQEPIRRHPTETAWPSFLREGVDNPRPVQKDFRSSWKPTLYVATVTIAEFGWLYLLGLTLVRSVQWILI